MNDLKNKTAFITGASRGIGKAIAESFLNKGHEVLTTCRDSSKFPFDNKLLTVHSLDISSKDSIDSFQSAVDAFEPDVLINNAGITKDNLFLRMSDEDWMDVITTNLTGTFRVTKLVAKGMLKRRWGRIINISSISGIMGNPGQTNYSASKAGMDGFTRSLAKELGSRNITVNAVAPGLTDTKLSAPIIRTDSMRDSAVSMIPMKRINKPEEIAETMFWLLTSAPDNLTGQIMHLDGGMRNVRN